ncbi:DUF6884 domain-containing protein [Natronorubrum texcoconense]|uniref:DUF6884 domain-containing protein n=1 Tax=Natronorubrum texcoconense TaxID=1095776 RepID=A0A1G9HBJ5_9EURY|nr:DUF6884 domain-containing protein [Natronorubrum texcoconense]SDL10114.1 hypothetical protein SAMN04515672_0180 [Natronorubrum texcoconense]
MTNPREHELPNGDLAVTSHWVWGVRDATTVAADDRPLYELLLDVLGGVNVPDCMPARLATTCENLIDVKHAVEDIERGRADIGSVGHGMSYCYRVRDAIADYRDRDPLRLVAVGCSGSKHDVFEPTPAKKLYKGGYWTNKRQYYEAFTTTPETHARIISAEHAVLEPDEPIDYYERVPQDFEGIPVDSSKRLPSGDDVDTLLDQWALRVFEGLQSWIRASLDDVDPRDVTLEILLGETKYAEPLRERGVFDGLSIPGTLEVRFPFRDAEGAQGGIGKQRGWMCNQIDAAVATDGGTDR